MAKQAQALPGAITFVQRFGDGLRLNAHVHSLVPDGVWLRGRDAAEPPGFHALPPPEPVEVNVVGTNVWLRTTRLLQKRGLYADADPAEVDRLAQDHPLLAAAYAASIRGTVACGPRAGQPVLRLGQATALDVLDTSGDDGAAEAPRPHHGFSVHAGVRVPAWDRNRLERICRYAARGPLASERLSLSEDGRVIYRLRKRWRDGSTHLVQNPHDFISRLCALVPPPRFHTTRFHGVFAPAHPLRPLIVPARAEADTDPGQRYLFDPPRRRARRRDGTPRATPRPRAPWPQLMRRTFGLDVLVCERCGGRLKLVGAVAPIEVVRRLLANGTERELPVSRLARGPPRPRTQGDLFANRPPAHAA